MRQLLLPDVWKYKTLSATNVVRIYGLPGNPNSLALLLFFAIICDLFLEIGVWEREVSMVLEYQSRAVPWSIHLDLFKRNMDFSLHFWLDFHFDDEKLASVEESCACWSRIDYSHLLPSEFWRTVFSNHLVLKHLQHQTGPGSIGEGLARRSMKTTWRSCPKAGGSSISNKGFEVFKDNPITGAGFGSFGGSATLSYGSPIYNHYGIRSDIYGGKYFYSDNQYIQVIAETGAIGVVLFAAFLLGMLAMFWKERKTVFGKFMIAFWFATGFSGFYYNIWELKMYTMFYFLIFGTFASHTNQYVKLKMKDL